MPLVSGTKLGPYEILSPLGAGGMGEVYRARDTRLDRTVAVKILPEHLAQNTEAKQRFEREARSISSLNHANICALYDVGTQDSTSYLVMEFVQGETLEARLLKGPVPLKQALEYGIQICNALEKAHRAGIVHRDLKPGNIMLTPTGAKLLDFGLAKPVASMVGKQVAPLTGEHTPSSPTINLTSLTATPQALTQQGSIVGTFQFMAPEVLQGAEADARSDIFSLGCVLYEMVTGKRAFEGKSQISVMSAILEKDPEPITTLQPASPPALEQVVKTCLAKDPDERFQNVHDVKLHLKWIAEGGSQTAIPVGSATRRRGRERLLWLLVSGLAILASALAVWTYVHPRLAGGGPVLALVPPPRDTRFVAFGLGSGPAVVSPDETKLAFTAIDQNGVIKLWTRSLKANDAAAVPGTDGAVLPFWSADGRSLGFFAGGKLKTVELNGGNLQALADSSSPGRAAWAPDGTILFRPAASSPLFRVPSTGGQAVPVQPLGSNDYSQSEPAILPDGEHFLLVVTDKRQHNRIELRSLASSETKLVLEGAGQPAYSGGFLFFVRDRKVLAQPFDATSGKLSGTAAPLADADSYSLSGPSVLAFQSYSLETHLQWFEKGGNASGTVGQVGSYVSPKIAPDGKQILFFQGAPQISGTNDLWSVPAAGGVSRRITFGPGWKLWSVWSPDGKYIAYGVSNAGKASIARRPADGSGAEETLASLGPEITSASVVDWSPDGRYLSYNAFNINQGRFALWIMPLFGDRKPFECTPGVTGNQYDGNFSPDGHWLAYFSDESGRLEVYVVPFPGLGGKYQISQEGGRQLRWDKKGDLFFLTTGSQLMKAELNLSAQSLQVKSMHALFQMNLADEAAPLFDVTADGERFIAVTSARPESSSISLLLNWPALLHK
jgi:serine/threonine protein kinase/Tol biopolymer transport system component